jgi:hypothetical protein
MKRVLFAVLACAALGAVGQEITREQHEKLSVAIASQSCKANSKHADMEIRSILGQFESNYYYGRSALVYLKENKYKDLTIFDLAMHYCIGLPRPLGPIEKWRYESCQTDAAKAPTSQGVNAGLRICREKFGQ